MAKRKRRTSIRTAAGVAQERFLDRVRALRDDPLRVLPECPHGEPKPIAVLRAGLEKVAAGKVGFFMRRDKEVLGAVIASRPIADLDSVPRLLDTKVAGKRRFFLTRGHVSRTAMLGVQNFEEPRALLMAYRAMAKRHSLHFFAGPRLWCTGSKPLPPQDWIDRLADAAEVRLEPVDGGWSTGTGARVRLGFRDGPFIDVDRCKGDNMHQRISAGYAGPRERHPVTLHVVLPDGTVEEPDREAAAAYRGGIKSERDLIDAAVAGWRQRTREADTGPRFVLGTQDFGADQEAFLDALGAEGHERAALQAMTAAGSVGKAGGLADVLARHEDHLVDGVRAVLGEGANAFIASQAKQSPRDVIRAAHEEAQARQRESALPTLTGLGPAAVWIDGLCRTLRRSGRRAASDAIRHGLDEHTLPAPHLYAFLHAIGGDVSLEARFAGNDKQTGQALTERAKAIVEAEGEAYAKALRDYVATTGLGA